MTRSTILISLVAAAASTVIGCSSNVGSSAEGVTYTRTIVHLGPEGIVSKQVVQITAQQQAADRAVLMASKAGNMAFSGTSGGTHTEGNVQKDSSCAGSDLWMFDDVNLTGNELCIYASALPAYAFWSDLGWDTTLSYWAGNQSGDMEDGRTCRITFTAGDTWHNVTSCYTQNEVSF